MDTVYGIVWHSQQVGERPNRHLFDSLTEACAAALANSRCSESLVHVFYERPNGDEVLVMICRQGRVIKWYYSLSY